MKKLFLAILVSMLFSSVYSKQKLIIKGKIKGAYHKKFYLEYFHTHKSLVVIDSCISDKYGNITFSRVDHIPEGLMIIQFNGNVIELLSDSSSFTFSTELDDLVLNMNVKNSYENIIYYNYKKFLKKKKVTLDSLLFIKSTMTQMDQVEKLNHQIKKLNWEVNLFRKEFFYKNQYTLASKVLLASIEPKKNSPDSMENYFFAKHHFFDNIDFSDQRLLRTPYYFSKIEKYLTTYTVNQYDSIKHSINYILSKSILNQQMFEETFNFIFNNYINNINADNEKICIFLVEEYISKGKIKNLDEAKVNLLKNYTERVKATVIGTKAPELNLKDFHNKEISLHEIKSKYTILIFWDVECDHCLSFIPEVNKIYNNLSKSQVKVFAVSVGKNKNLWTSFIKQNNLKEWENVYDPTEKINFFEKYNFKSTPSLFLLDSEKKIIAKEFNLEYLKHFFKIYFSRLN